MRGSEGRGGNQAVRRQHPQAGSSLAFGIGLDMGCVKAMAVILVNHEAEAARGALAFDDAAQAARLKSPRLRAERSVRSGGTLASEGLYVNQNVR
jgi:hypothetical protein